MDVADAGESGSPSPSGSQALYSIPRADLAGLIDPSLTYLI